MRKNLPKVKKLKIASRYSKASMLLWGAAFAFVGVAALLITRAATPGIAVTIDASLPKVSNIKTYPDDQTVTLTWDRPSNVNGLVGYYVKWGLKGGALTNAKQVDTEIAQIQPLVNGTAYDITVQTIQGSAVQVDTSGAWGGGTAVEGRASGKVSSPVSATATPTSARVDDLRAKMTGFFDDFNTPAGAFDELKWNTALSACTKLGTAGAFINNQFHAHSQVRSEEGSYNDYCDRSSIVQRPRAIFDITGRTEADPGVVVGDFDGTTMESGRDTFYIDLVPLNVRSNNIPLDITSHADAFDAEAADPAMIRLTQNRTFVGIKYTGNNKQPSNLSETVDICPDFKGEFHFDWCGGDVQPVVSAFPQTEVPLFPYTGKIPVPNVRHHFRFEISPTKLKVFINGVKLLEGPLPADFVNVKKYTVQTNLFSYNTGKDASSKPQTSIIHWDNFGFNGIAPTTVVHSYQEGGSTGGVPYLGTGTVANPIPKGQRTTKIPVPDPVGTPQQARLLFTLQNIGFGEYTWQSTDNVVVNGKKYSLPNPSSLVSGTYLGASVAGHFIPFAQGIILNNADVKQGTNDVTFNISGTDVINAHLELEYTKGTEPSYTQPPVIFGAAAFAAATHPTMLSHDNYLYVEQDMGLPSGVIDGSTPVTPPPVTGDTTKPTVTITTPANNTVFTVGATINVSADAADNVGVSKVEFYLGGISKGTDTTSPSPYTAGVSTTGLTAGFYALTAVASDAAGNTTTSNTVTITVSQPPNTPPPTSTKFQTLPVGATLPSEADCKSRVRPAPETRASVNAAYNARKGVGGNYYYPRVTGDYTGTTDEIIQWAACKWGMDEDLLRAQAVQESYWFQNAIGDFTTDGASCTPVYPIANYPAQYSGDSTHNSSCPESIGLLQVRWNYHQSGFYQDAANSILTNNAVYSTAYNVDYYGAVWRECFDGNMGWLNTVERGATYAAGDATGCQGVWFAGRWMTAPAQQYIAAVQSNLNNRVWESTAFKNATSVNGTKTPPATTPPTPPPDTTAPNVTLTSPTSGQLINGTLTITANASDAVGVTSVSFYLDGSATAFSTDTTSPYNAIWNSATITNGTHTVTAKARDAANNVGSSAAVTINVTNVVADTTIPKTSITAPANGATVSSIYAVTASASDNVGVSKVELLVDGTVRASDPTSPFSFAWDTSSFSDGAHTLQTKAYDAASNTGLSATLSVTVKNTVVPPPRPKTGDVDGDGRVGSLDISTVLFNWGRTSATRAQGDLNGDGIVNVYDISLLLANWGK